jgi:hypothetical protein
MRLTGVACLEFFRSFGEKFDIIHPEAGINPEIPKIRKNVEKL